MWSGSETIEIAATPEEVWAIVSDLSRHAALAGSGEVKAIRADGPLGPGSTWEADEEITGAGQFVARSECITFEPPRVLGWRSFPPPIAKGNERSVPDVTWSYTLEPVAGATLVEHAFRVVEPKVGALRLKMFYLVVRREKTIRRGMRKTLLNLRAAAETEREVAR